MNKSIVISQIRISEPMHSKLKSISEETGSSMNSTMLHMMHLGLRIYEDSVVINPHHQETRQEYNSCPSVDDRNSWEDRYSDASIEKAIAKANSVPYILGEHFELPRILRRYIKDRDNHICQYCGSDADVCTDHVLPRSKGGKSTLSNLVASCRKCNSKKGARTPEEAGMALLNVGEHSAEELMSNGATN